MATNLAARRVDTTIHQPGAVSPTSTVGIYPIGKKPNGKRTIKGGGIKLQWFPNSFAIKRTPEYSSRTPIGMNDAKKFYVGGETSITIRVQFVFGRLDGNDLISAAATLAGYARNNGSDTPPPLLYLDLGPVTNTMTSPSNRWILTEVPIDFSLFMARFDYSPTIMETTLTFTLAPYQNIESSQRSF